MTFSFAVPPVLALRFLLGFFESVFGPVLLTITVQWYLLAEQPAVQAIWQSMLGAAITLISLMAYGFYHVDYEGGAGLRGWQWLFLTVAILSFISSGEYNTVNGRYLTS
jgi:MFS family permease